MMNILYNFALKHPVLTVIGFLLFILFIIAVWWFVKRRRTENDPIIIDKSLYENQYFEQTKDKIKQDINDEEINQQVRIIEPLEETIEDVQLENISKSEESAQKKSSLIIVLYIKAFSSKGFNGTDIFAAMEQVGLKYGENRIFHYYGAEQLITSQPIFSVANLLEPGIFYVEKMKDFNTPGLACFMCLPTVLSGRVAFELMLHCTKRLADLLKGKLEEEHQQAISAEYINFMRYNIERFEYQQHE